MHLFTLLTRWETKCLFFLKDVRLIMNGLYMKCFLLIWDTLLIYVSFSLCVFDLISKALLTGQVMFNLNNFLLVRYIHVFCIDANTRAVSECVCVCVRVCVSYMATTVLYNIISSKERMIEMTLIIPCSLAFFDTTCQVDLLHGKLKIC